MPQFHYKVSASVSDNVGVIDAKNEADAMAKLKEIYMPPLDGEEPKGIGLVIIDKPTHDKEKKRIFKERQEEANWMAEPEPESEKPKK